MSHIDSTRPATTDAPAAPSYNRERAEDRLAGPSAYRLKSGTPKRTIKSRWSAKCRATLSQSSGIALLHLERKVATHAVRVRSHDMPIDAICPGHERLRGRHGQRSSVAAGCDLGGDVCRAGRGRHGQGDIAELGDE